ncbi:MAG: alginate lyase family protein [Chitinophagaceae bacterium]
MKRLFLLMLLSLSCCYNVSAQPNNIDSFQGKLLLNKQSFVNIQSNIKSHTWAQTIYKNILASADEWVGKQLRIPPKGGNWYHYYASPKDGALLKPGREIAPWQWEHISTSTGEIFFGDSANIRRDFDGCVLYIRHQELAHALYNLGFAFQLTGDHKYAEKAKSILIGYTDIYLKLPMRDKTGTYNLNDSTGCGHISVQSLDESVWLITVVQGADMIWNQLSVTEKNYVTERFLLPATDVIMAHRMEVHNIQCWKNAAVGMTGFLLNDKRLIEHAMNDAAGGFNRQLKEGITSEGLWWERSPSYHFYAITPLIYLAETALQNNYPLDMQSIKRLFDGPITISTPFLTLPAFNDSNPANLEGNADLYTWAYARFKDDSYVNIISKQVPNSVFQLIYTKGKLPESKNIPKQSVNLKDTKFAILTRGAPQTGAWLSLKYDMNNGGWHSQDDKLSFVLYKGKQEIAIDPGVERYGSILHKGWFLSTFAHNSLLVDEEQQKRAGGEMIAFGTQSNVDFLVTRCNGAYDGVELRRSVAMLDSTKILVIDQFISDSLHTYDVPYHQHGEWLSVPKGERWIAPDKRGYKYLTNVSIRQAKSNQSLSTKLASGEKMEVSIHNPAGQTMQIISGMGLFRNNSKAPALVQRQTGKEALFVWCISIDGKPVSIQSSTLKSKDGIPLALSRGCSVTVSNDRGKKWTIHNNPDKVSLQNGSAEPFTVKD